MKQQVEMAIKMTFEVDASLDAGTLVHQLGHWVSETMRLMDDRDERYVFIESNVISLAEEAYIYGSEPHTDSYRSRFFAFGNILTDALERNDTIRVKSCLNMGIGTLYKFDGSSPAALLSAYDGWDGFFELTEIQYKLLGGS